jgi:hypothetical protein
MSWKHITNMQMVRGGEVVKLDVSLKKNGVEEIA